MVVEQMARESFLRRRSTVLASAVMTNPYMGSDAKRAYVSCSELLAVLTRLRAVYQDIWDAARLKSSWCGEHMVIQDSLDQHTVRTLMNVADPPASDRGTQRT